MCICIYIYIYMRMCAYTCQYMYGHLTMYIYTETPMALPHIVFVHRPGRGWLDAKSTRGTPSLGFDSRYATISPGHVAGGLAPVRNNILVVLALPAGGIP